MANSVGAQVVEIYNARRHKKNPCELLFLVQTPSGGYISRHKDSYLCGSTSVLKNLHIIIWVPEEKGNKAELTLTAATYKTSLADSLYLPFIYTILSAYLVY